MTWQATIIDRFRAHLAGAPRPVAGTPLACPPLPGSAEAALVWALHAHTGRTVVWIGDGGQSLDVMHRDLLTLAPDPARPPHYFPSRGSFPGQDVPPDLETTGHRLALLGMLADPAGTAAGVIATTVQAMLQRTLPPAALRGHTLSLRSGDAVDRDAVVAHLERSGYALVPLVDAKGQAAVRGELIDVWPVAGAWPVRIELDFDRVGSLRTFEPHEQRSLDRLPALVLPPTGEWQDAPADGDADGAAPETVLAYLPGNCVFVWSDPDRIHHHGALFVGSAMEAGAGETLNTPEALRAAVAGLPDTLQVEVGVLPDAGAACVLPDVTPLPDIVDSAGSLSRPDLLEKARETLVTDFCERAARGQSVFVVLDTGGATDHFVNIVTTRRGQAPDALGMTVRQGPLSGGFASEQLDMILATQPDLYGGAKRQGRRYDPIEAMGHSRPRQGARIVEMTDLAPDDLVVHVEHGIGRYLGLQTITFNERRQEVLTIEYAEGAKLHVPASQTHLLTRYVGISRTQAPLHRLGGKRWNREKQAAEEAIADLATSLLETQAHRNVMKGFAFAPDNTWQHEFEAAFPYRETRDQHDVIEAVKRDMQERRPMDRLICGDAGYGKTEVAMRAAFKTVMSARQVAVLVPTTVLAQQHFDTFSTRMADYPVRIEMLSRFRSQGRREATLRGMADGSVDIVIGTHALLQPSVAFKDLGLVIIDEEQRFGVTHKESFKHIRQLVDVLTLTATPIPRTLYMSMTGVRDLSLLQSPPLERLAIETVVARYEDRAVRQAILREINREGQVFYLHNRVMTIERVCEHLSRLVPEARFDVAHGRMAAGELARVMRRFVNGEFDVLVCTTIIESGMDIPRANTILIDRADRFGIADLYQLRGRVGRSSRKAYAYLLLPPYGRVDADARKRISALRKYSGLSAGFNLALRDLEIRGAGNLLGAAQSGHITSIGFGLYCQLLKRTVAVMQQAPLPRLVDVDTQFDFIDLSPTGPPTAETAGIPYDYVEDEGLRVAIYRKLAEASNGEDLEALTAELRDRFGPLPGAAGRLFKIATLRILAADHGVRRIETREGKVMLTGARDYLMRGARFPRLSAGTVDERLDEVADLIRTCATWSAEGTS